MTALPNARYERKFIPAGLDLQEVVALVHRHPAGFSAAYPPRAVNNIYLDTPGLSAYHEHVSGAAERSKTRLRWYGSWKDGSRLATLELKLKSGLLSGKRAQPLGEFSLAEASPQVALESALDRAHLPELARASLRQLRPSLCNRYRRHYFLSADRRFRLTLDTELQFGRPESTLLPSAWAALPLIVLELKFDPQYADHVSVVTNYWLFRLARCSKYVLGVSHL